MSDEPEPSALVQSLRVGVQLGDKEWRLKRALHHDEFMATWRVGRSVPLNVYEGDRPVCQCHTAEDAARIVAAVNFARAQGK